VSAYIDTPELKLLGSLPAEDVDDIETRYPGIVAKTISVVCGLYDARLAKRYAAPFVAPYPDALKFNVAREVAWRLYIKRGFNPSGAMDQLLEKEHTEADAWLREAADSEKGLVELPARQATPGEATAINQGGPYGYSEASPYAWTNIQRDAADWEDR
jgi:hypothetical protein